MSAIYYPCRSHYRTSLKRAKILRQVIARTLYSASSVLNLGNGADILFYVAGYWVKKVLTVHACDKCNLLLKDRRNEARRNVAESFTEFKSYSESGFRGLTVPTDFGVSVVAMMENIFMENFELVMNMNLPRYRMVNVALNSDLFTQFSDDCIPIIIRMVHAFFRMRIYAAVKLFNQSLRANKGKKQNRKLLKVSNL